MAYQALNIIGSLTMGVPVTQREMDADRSRADAYRALMKEQVQLRGRTTPDDVQMIEAPDSMIVGDAPEERSNRYQFPRGNQDRTVFSSIDENEEVDGSSDGPLDVIV